LKDATRPSRVKPLTPEKIKQVLHMTLHAKPPNATHWSLRSMAAAAGVSYSSVQRIWHAHGLKPHLVETFKVSRDKNFAAKVEDVVGLYLDPPDRALVLCVDEKSQIQALDRTVGGREPRTKVPCMGHLLSRGDFHSFPLFLFLQFFCSAPGGAILPPRPLVPSAGARSGGQGWPGPSGHRVSGAQRP
jgi:hypothetical protein